MSLLDLLQSKEEEILSGSYVGQAGSLDPALLTAVPLPQTDPLGKNLQQESNTSSLDSLLAGFGLQSESNSITGALTTVAKGLNVDPNYNPFEDPALKAEGPDFITRYGSSFVGAPNSDFTKGLIERTKKNEMLREQIAANGVSGFVGQMLGSMTDPINLIGFYGAASTLSRAGRFALGGAQAGAAVGAGSVLQGQADPTKTLEEIIQETAGAAVLGGLLFSLGPTAASLPKSTIDGLKDFTKGGVAKSDIDFSDIQGGFGSAGAARVGEMDRGYDILFSNPVFQKTFEKSSWLTAQDRLLSSTSDIVKHYANKYTEHNYILSRNTEGMATPTSFATDITVSTNLKIQPLLTQLEQLYAGYKQAGGAKGYNDFLVDSVHTRLGLKTIVEKEVREASSILGKYFDQFVPELQARGVLPDNWVNKNSYFPIRYDWNKITYNRATFEGDIMKELVRENPAAAADELMLRSDAQEIADQMLKQSVGDVSENLQFKARGLEKRVLNFSPEFQAKYQLDDIEQTIQAYTKQYYTSTIQKDFFKSGDEDVWKYMESNVRKDYQEMRDKLANKKNLSPEDLNRGLAQLDTKMEQDLNDLKDLYDMHNGMFTLKDGRNVRIAAAIAKTYQTLRLMGKRVIASIPDLARAKYSTFAKSEFNTELGNYLNTTVKQFKLFGTKDDARMFGLLSEKLSMMSSRQELMDDMTLPPVVSGIEKYLRTVNTAFNKITLFDKYTDTLNVWAAEDVAKNLINASMKIKNGTLKPGSMEYIEFYKLGGSDKLAKQILEQFEKHKLIEEYAGGNVVLSNFKNWDPRVAIEFGSIIKRAVDNRIITPTIGSKPTFMSRAFWSVVTQFLGFQMTAMNKILLPAMQQASGMGSEYAVKTLLQSTNDIMLAATAATIRGFVSGKDSEEVLDPKRAILGAYQYSAMLAMVSTMTGPLDKLGLGPSQLLGVSKYSKFYDRSLLEILAGPSFGMIDPTVNMAFRLADGNITDTDIKKSIKLLPLSNLLWWDWAVNNINKQEQK